MRFTQSDLQRLSHVKDLVTADLSRRITIPELARLTGFNERKLQEGFKRIYHETIFRFLLKQQMELAQKLLKETNLPVTEIALQVGHKHPENFTHAFKKYYKTSPLQFRKAGE